jgi:hypothetical protein
MESVRVHRLKQKVFRRWASDNRLRLQRRALKMWNHQQQGGFKNEY